MMLNSLKKVRNKPQAKRDRSLSSVRAYSQVSRLESSRTRRERTKKRSLARSEKDDRNDVIGLYRQTLSSTTVFLSLAVGCLFFANTAWAQKDTLYLNLETILEVGGANNLTLERYKRQEKLAEADLTKAREWWLPEIYAGIKGHGLSGAAMNADGGFFLDVNRSNMWTGLGLDAQWDFGEGIYRAQAEKLRLKAQMHQTKAKRNEILLETIHAYYDFLAAQLYSKAYLAMAQQSDSIASQLQKQVESGLRYESELLLSQSKRNHLQIKQLEAQKRYRKAKARLINLLNLSSDREVVATDALRNTIDLVPPQEWQNNSPDSTFTKRPEYDFLHAQLDAIKKERKRTTTGLFLPEVRIGTNPGYFGGLFQDVRPMNPAATPNPDVLYPTTGVNASLMWRLPLGRLTSQGRLKQADARLALQENQLHKLENQVNEEVSQARSELQSAQEQLELGRESQSLARKAVQQSVKRQKLGTAEPFEVFQAQEFYLQARLDYLEALANYNKAQYSYYVAVGNDL